MTKRRKKVGIITLVCVSIILICITGTKIYSRHQLLYAHSHDSEARILCREVIIVETSEKAIRFKYVDDIVDLEFKRNSVVQTIHTAYLRDYTVIRDEWGRKRDWTDIEPGQRARICVTSIVTHMYENKYPYYKELFETHDKCYEILLR